MAKTKTENPRGNHGDFLLMHGDMFSSFSRWEDEVSVRTFGWKISDLRRIEALIARFVTAPELTDEGVIERDRILEEYRQVWRPRRLQISGC